MTPTRDNGLDVAKGLAIVLIVAAHVLRGLAADHLLDLDHGPFARADTAMYLVHLPTFVLLAGLFVARGVDRRGRTAYLRRRLLDLVWVFLVWTLLQGSVKVLTSSLVNTPLSPRDLLVEFIHPTSQLWFLPFLLTMTLLAVVPVIWRGHRAAVAVPAAAAVSLTMWGCQGTYVGTLGWGLCMFFAVGVVLGHERFTLLMRRPSVGVLAVVGVAGFVVVVLCWHPTTPTGGWENRTVATVVLGVAASLGGTLALLRVAAMLVGQRVGAPLAYLGRRSMEIFLAHIIFASGARIVLVKCGITAVAPHVVVGVSAGMVGPLVLVLLARHRIVGWLFTAPAVQRSPR